MLEREERESSLKNKVYDLLHPADVRAEKIVLKPGSAFYKITAADYRGKIPWKAVENAAGKLCVKAVLPDGIDLPENSPIKRFEPAVYPFRVLFKSAVSVLEKMSLEPTRLYVTVFDENAYVIDLIEELVSLACCIRIITSCFDDYSRLADRLLSRYGISLVIRTAFDKSVLESTVIISDKSAFVPMTYKGILFTNEKRRMLSTAVMSGKKITLPEKYEKLCAKKADRLTFAGALYELCGIDELDGLVYDDI
ncbi:MAG: hypothetical protein ACI4W6_11100 [Acutalibacteraceae bacterium]